MPTTPLGRTVCFFAIIIGVLLLSMPISVISSAFSEFMAERKAKLEKRERRREFKLLKRLGKGKCFVFVFTFSRSYGDIVPTTPLGLTVCFFTIVIGISLFSMPISVVSEAFAEFMAERKAKIEKTERHRESKLLKSLGKSALCRCLCLWRPKFCNGEFASVKCRILV